jgi:transcriptional regulator with XRE-family HTH domain
VVVDLAFPTRLRELREGRGLSLRQLGKLVSYSHTSLWAWETGRGQPTPDGAARLDAALDAGGALAGMVIEDRAPLTPDDEDRIDWVTKSPHTVDAVAMGSFAVILAHQRLLEDRVGSGPLIAPVVGQLAVLENVVIEANGPLRPTVVDVAAQWAQFSGWLHSSSGRYDEADRWLTRALDWATEADDRDLIATVVSFKGHVAYRLAHVGPMIGLSAAAQRDPAVYVEQRAFSALQEARGHAMAGDRVAVDRKLAEAADLIAAAAESTDPMPPWSYYYRSPGFFELVRGLVYRYLGRESAEDNAHAVETLEAGRATLPEDMRASEWAGEFVYHLAIAHAQVGDIASASAVLEEARRIVVATGSTRLSRMVERLARRLER